MIGKEVYRNRIQHKCTTFSLDCTNNDGSWNKI